MSRVWPRLLPSFFAATSCCLCCVLATSLSTRCRAHQANSNIKTMVPPAMGRGRTLAKRAAQARMYFIAIPSLVPTAIV
jgi:hypothetical protein